MSRYRIMMALAGAAAVWCAAPLAVTNAAQARAGDAAWGKAIEVPGLGALNAGGFAQVSSVSCASAGNCAAGGFYNNRHGLGQAFVASERNGRWGTAIEVPGTATLNTAGGAQVSSVSCASAGNCVAGGFYTQRPSHEQAFVASERNGRWGTAIEVPGTATLDTAGGARVNSVSCASAGNCTIGGSYTDGSGQQAFMASERNGHWGTAIEVLGTRALNVGGNAQVGSVSCASAGNCTAGGSYADGTSCSRCWHFQVFVASERNGHWGRAIEVPGTRTLNAGGNAHVDSVSCASAGNCTAGGFYEDGTHRLQAFVASQLNGRWRRAIEVPGTRALNAGNAHVGSVSCASAGNCTAGGDYLDGHGFQGFVVSAPKSAPEVSGKICAIEPKARARERAGPAVDVDCWAY